MECVKNRNEMLWNQKEDGVDPILYRAAAVFQEWQLAKGVSHQEAAMEPGGLQDVI